MKKFEYKIVNLELDKYNVGINLDSSEAILTGEGLTGWEAVGVIRDSTAMGVPKVLVLMKREIEE